MLHHILLSFTMLSLEGKFDPPHTIYLLVVEPYTLAICDL